MGIHKELDITYQDAVNATAKKMLAGENWYGAESVIWNEIGQYDHDLADQLTDEYKYEAALVIIEQGHIPHENEDWQRLVVRLAYNAITSTEEFEYCIAHSRFSTEEVQQMLDLACGAVLQNPNFRLTGFQQLSPQ